MSRRTRTQSNGDRERGGRKKKLRELLNQVDILEEDKQNLQRRNKTLEKQIEKLKSGGAGAESEYVDMHTPSREEKKKLEEALAAAEKKAKSELDEK